MFTVFYGFSDSFLSFFLKTVGIFTIIGCGLLSNSDDEGRVGIKRLITRNQFVDNTTRGFESLPLRQKQRTHHECVLCFLTQRIRSEHCTVRCEGSHTPLVDRRARSSGGEREYLRKREYPSHTKHHECVLVFLHRGSGTSTVK